MQLFPPTKALAHLISGVGLVLCATSSHADYVWLERRDAGTFVIQAGLLDGERASAAALESGEVRQNGTGRPSVVLRGDRIEVSRVQPGDLRFVAHKAMPDGSLVFYQAKWGRSDTKPELDLELVPTEPDGNTFRLMWKGNPVAASRVNVTTTEGWRRVLHPGEDGTVTLDTPFPGMYLLELTAKVNGSANVDGKKYENVRHTATVSFVVDP